MTAAGVHNCSTHFIRGRNTLSYVVQGTMGFLTLLASVRVPSFC